MQIVRMLPFASVSQYKNNLRSFYGSFKQSQRFPIENRALDWWSRSGLASINIFLKKINSKVRFYCFVDSFWKWEQDLNWEWRVAANFMKKSQQLLNEVATRFSDQKHTYWEGDWSLTEEFSANLGELWIDSGQVMASDRRMVLWSLTEKPTGKKSFGIFPIKNEIRDVIP